jgi:hypothetical protein
MRIKETGKQGEVNCLRVWQIHYDGIWLSEIKLGANEEE